MHRQTPLSAGFVGYTGGGSRTLIDTVDDGKMMQEMKGTMMHGEARDSVESPQNYGFSSVVRPATKDENGMIKDGAEGFMSYAGGNRSFAFCAVMDDRRYRPMGLKPGENSQYDDLGQMTLLRRTGVYLLTNDNPEDNQQQGGASSAGASTRDSGGGSQQVQRFVSLRHVEKQKQQRPGQAQGGAQSGGGAQDYKHEGESINLEVRVSKTRIEFRSGDNVVGYYDKGSSTWVLIGTVNLGDATGVVPVGILGSIDTAGDELVAALAQRVNAE
jgi:phage gp45-like